MWKGKMIGSLRSIMPDMLWVDFKLSELEKQIKILKNKYPQYSDIYFYDDGQDETHWMILGKPKDS